MKLKHLLLFICYYLHLFLILLLLYYALLFSLKWRQYYNGEQLMMCRIGSWPIHYRTLPRHLKVFRLIIICMLKSVCLLWEVCMPVEGFTCFFVYFYFIVVTSYWERIYTIINVMPHSGFFIIRVCLNILLAGFNI